MTSIPTNVKYSKTDEWVRVDNDEATIGITDYAQSALSDVVFVELPLLNLTLRANDPFGTVESVKAASDIFAPLTGKVVEINETIVEDPSIVNSDAEGEGWFFRLEIDDPEAFEQLLHQDGYDEYLETL